jgi:hypothetical protein
MTEHLTFVEDLHQAPSADFDHSPLNSHISPSGKTIEEHLIHFIQDAVSLWLYPKVSMKVHLKIQMPSLEE